ncbi:MAG: SRPBCC domain-containing protein [Elusimicrobiales bacterium]|nr:SRPBCC domain-containing protein [Elusimicrobiales bacterium]
MNADMMNGLPKARHVIVKEAVVAASRAEVWRAWTTSEGAMTFFAPKANISLAIGGPYEVYFDPADERMGTKGLKILSYLPEEMISFQWNAPPDMPVVRRELCWVVVQFSDAGDGLVKVRLTHLGWKEGEEWDKAFNYFQRAWDFVFDNLKRRFSDGPVDWGKS